MDDVYKFALIGSQEVTGREHHAFATLCHDLAACPRMLKAGTAVACEDEG